MLSPVTFPSKLNPVPDMWYLLPFGKRMIFAVCSLTVRVPVLSDAITVQLPSDSAAFNFRTMTFFFAILLAAIVRAVVKASGRPSGMTETARAITETKTSCPGAPFRISKVATRTATIPTIRLICFESFSTRRVSGDFVFFALLMLSAILPISVFRPILTTIALARPVMIVVPEKSIFDCSASDKFSFSIGRLFFVTLTLSPVRIDSLTVKLFDSITRKSALILSPDSRTTTSPKVSSSALISTVSLFLITFVFVVTSLARAAAVLLALFSW